MTFDPQSWLIFLALLIIGAWIASSIYKLGSEKKEKTVERKFIEKNEGRLFFCYTNKEKTKDIVESEIIPILPLNTSIIRLEGKQPITEFPERWVSSTLSKLEEVGFPNLMLILNERVWDVSMKKSFYDSLNQGDRDLSTIVESSLQRLRNKAEQVGGHNSGGCAPSA